MSTSENKRVILLNGPPNSGKDLSAIILRNMMIGKFDKKGRMFKPETLKFADPIKMASHALLNIPFSCEHYEKEHGNDWKNNPQVEFFGLTPREVYISISEEFAKPKFGPRVFGRVAARRVQLAKNTANTFIFSDSGFAEEAIPLVGLVGVDNVLVIELERVGCSYDNDSRSYISNELNEHFHGKLRTTRIKNNQDQAFLTLLLKGAMMHYFDLEASF